MATGIPWKQKDTFRQRMRQIDLAKSFGQIFVVKALHLFQMPAQSNCAATTRLTQQSVRHLRQTPQPFPRQRSNP